MSNNFHNPHGSIFCLILFHIRFHSQGKTRTSNSQVPFLVWLLPTPLLQLQLSLVLHQLFPKDCWPRPSGLSQKLIYTKPPQINHCHPLRPKGEWGSLVNLSKALKTPLPRAALEHFIIYLTIWSYMRSSREPMLTTR